MKRKNLTAIKKVKRDKLVFTDQKIKNSYSKFKSSVFKNIKKKHFAIAVSGGSDSLCLAYFSKLYSFEFGNKIHTLIVDHKLRKESKQEALKVKGMLLRKNISSKILNNNDKIPNKNIQKNARDSRYNLLSGYCLKKNIKYLITAHHEEDQIENFFIRLSRGSGVTGLSSMSTCVSYSHNLKIIRPFLNFKKEDLKYATIKYFKDYIKDPSNENDKFLRIKIRKLNKMLIGEKKLFNARKIKKTIDNLSSARDALAFYKVKAMYNYAHCIINRKNGNTNSYMINRSVFRDEAKEIIFKLFSEVLSKVSKSYYPPKSRKVINLIEKLKKSKSHKSTLGGCIIESNSSYVLVTKEARLRNIPNQLRK